MDKEKVLELAREVWSAAGGTVYIGPSISQVEEFAYLVERELRGDAEPVAWMSPKKERLEFSRADTVYGSHTIPLYTHPAPAVVRQLVEALQDILVAYRDSIGLIDQNHNSPLTVKAHNALAAAKENGL